MKSLLIAFSFLAASDAYACKALEIKLTPVQTIASALEAAATQGACAVTIQLAAGSYMETSALQITRPTTIEGEAATAVDTNASFLNSQGFNLSLKRLKVIGAKDNAVVQNGGVLEMMNVSLLRTQAASLQTNSGVALVATGGATVKAAVVDLSENQNGAVVLSGKRTLAQFGLGAFANNQILPSYLSEEKIGNQAAFRVTAGAEAYLYFGSFQDNQVVALSASGSNSKIYVRNGTVSGTRSVGPYSGTGILMQDGAKLIIEKISLKANEGVGLSLNKGFATATDVVVEQNPVGVIVAGFPTSQDYDPQSCLKMKFVGGEKQMESSVLSSGVKNSKSCPQFPWKWDANMRVYLR